ncbi:winged helix-turn-helix domain-containing protein [Streptomyces sp. NPDC099088]|uniref:winged helix-turn-helix domain-containing protein n=1 Tax=Streptomyces sp. NPDC099088 TaxID=3366101 RepID=UPI003826833E
MLKRHGWSWQQPAQGAIKRDDDAFEVWKKETGRESEHRASLVLDRLRGRGWAVADSAAIQHLGTPRYHAGRAGARSTFGPSFDGGTSTT